MSDIDGTYSLDQRHDDVLGSHVQYGGVDNLQVRLDHLVQEASLLLNGRVTHDILKTMTSTMESVKQWIQLLSHQCGW